MQATAGKTLGHAAAYPSSASIDEGARPSESRAQADAQLDSKAAEAAPVDNRAPAPAGPVQTSTAEQPITEERKVQHSLPPMIQQLLSKTAKLKLPMPEVPVPALGSIPAPAAAPQAEAAASSAAPDQSSEQAVIPQAATATAQAPLFLQGSLFPGLSGEAPHFGSLLALPPPTNAAIRPPIQISFGSISQPQIVAEPEPASNSLPSVQVSALIHEELPHSGRPAEQSNGHVRLQPPETMPDRPAEEPHEPVEQSASVGLQGVLPSQQLNGELQCTQPCAARSTTPENPAPTPAIQRPQPVKRPQPARRAYMPNVLPPKPSQPSARPPPPGFGAMPASAPRLPSDSSMQRMMQSVPNAGEGEPKEAPPHVRQPRKPEPIKAAAAADNKEQGCGPSVTPGSSAASEASWHSASTQLGKEAHPEAAPSPRSTSSHSSTTQHSQHAANGSVRHHQTGDAAYSNGSHSAPSKQLLRSPATQSGEEDDVPHSFCCPITQVGSISCCEDSQALRVNVYSEVLVHICLHIEGPYVLCAGADAKSSRCCRWVRNTLHFLHFWSYWRMRSAWQFMCPYRDEVPAACEDVHTML